MRGDVRFNPSAVQGEAGARYSTELLEGEHGPSDRAGRPASPKVTSDFRGPPPTNDWWSSLLWPYDGNPYSRPMFPHPLAVRAAADGLGVGYPSEPKMVGRAYRFPYAEDLVISCTGLHAPDARVRSSSDWAVTAAWVDGPRHLDATFGHGLPFVYARTGGDARVKLAQGAQTWGSSRGEVLGVSVHGHDYGLFAPAGASWRKDGSAYVSELGGKGFFSVAVLPDHTPETLELFRRHAYAFVTGTRVTWHYEPREAKVTSHFEVKTTLVEPGADRLAEPLLALYPHQWKATHGSRLEVRLRHPARAMRLLAASAFDVERPFHGVLPVLPAVPEGRGQIEGYLHDEAGAADLFPVGAEGGKDIYWAGKSLGRVSTLAWIAHGLGDTKTVSRLVGALTHELDDWFDGVPPERFYYDAKWGTLIGFPASYHSNTELNDHHFQSAYFVWAAATVAALDPAGGASKRWTPIRGDAHPRRGEHGRRRHALPAPAVLRSVRRPLVGERPGDVRRRKQRGVFLRGRELRGRSGPVGGRHRRCQRRATSACFSTRRSPRRSSSTGSTSTTTSSPRSTDARSPESSGATAPPTIRGGTRIPSTSTGST